MLRADPYSAAARKKLIDGSRGAYIQLLSVHCCSYLYFDLRIISSANFSISLFFVLFMNGREPLGQGSVLSVQSQGFKKMLVSQACGTLLCAAFLRSRALLCSDYIDSIVTG